MAQKTPIHIQNSLQKRLEVNALRTLKVNTDLIDFCSNDYLGFSNDEQHLELTQKYYKSIQKIGATGSRLLSGQNDFVQELEQQITTFHESETALFFNSGFDANLSVFSTIGSSEDVILYDELVHASIRTGLQLSRAKSFSFKHNDFQNLEKKLQKHQGSTTIYVAVESVYSMDGDICLLSELVELQQQYNFYIIIDEAHGNGIYGEKGQGLAQSLNVEKNCFIRIHTYGKAFGSHGATVLSNQDIKSFLVNYARPFIYSTGTPFHTLCSVKSVYDILENDTSKVKLIHEKINLFNQLVQENHLKNITQNNSPIQLILIPDNTKCRNLAKKLQEKGFDVRAILSPTVQKGQERIRICLHTFNSDQQIQNLVLSIKKLIHES